MTSSSGVPLSRRVESGDHGLRRDVPLPHGDVEGFQVGELHLVHGHLRDDLLVREPLERQVLLAHQPLDGIATVIQGILATTAREPLTDLRASSGRLHELQPVLRRPLALRLRRQDVDAVAGPQLVVQRDELAADLGADGPMADLGVDRVREVHGGRARREVHHVAPRREDEDLASVEVDLQPLHELPGVGHVLQPLHHLTQPREVGGVARLLAAFLVAPVRGDAELRRAVHVARPDLDLERLAPGPDDRRVQRLVHVRLGHGDVVLEPAGDGTPEGMHRAERGVGIAEALHLDPHADQVVDLVELLAADHHLLVDGIQVLRPSLDVRLDPQLLQLAAQGRRDAVDQRLPLTSTRFDQARDLSVRPRVERLEGQILELPLHLLDAEPVRERRVDLQRLGRDPPLLLFGERRDRSHVVETVGELDQQDPDVARHRHDHLPDVLGLLLFAGLELDPLQLGQPVHDPRDLVAEVLFDLGHRDVGVLHRVVQERGGDRRRVQMQVGEDRRDGDGMQDEVLARETLLALVGRPRRPRTRAGSP